MSRQRPNGPAEVFRPRGDRLADPPAQGIPTVLMVEDDSEFALDMTVILRGTVKLLCVGGTAAAAAHLLRSKPDALWLDIDLDPFFAETSALEGLAFLKVVRKRIDPDLPVIVVSSRLSPEAQRTLEELGVAAFYSKPPDPKALAETLRHTIP